MSTTEARAVLVYGRSGSGKSAQIGLVGALASRAGKRVGSVVALSDGLASVQSTYGVAGLLDPLVVQDVASLTMRLRAIAKANSRPDVLIIDDLSVLFRKLQETKAASADQWVQVDIAMTAFMNALKELVLLGVSVLMSAWEAPPKTVEKARDGNRKDYLGGPAFAGKIGEALAGYCGVTLRMAPDESFPCGNKDYAIHCGEDSSWIGRDRLNVIRAVSPAFLPALLPDFVAAADLVALPGYDVVAGLVETHKLVTKSAADVRDSAVFLQQAYAAMPNTGEEQARLRHLRLLVGASYTLLWLAQPRTAKAAFGW